ncbi:hypothetical protein [Conexibacter sp. SYSU D00693]|uniref:hypothetical protein n=1 Tax=Conexibacter sp. SYSU D00693 TaxID=2812560 RepID=UPI00196B7103|nr:hypothetical protein [Conexibacter sp. SYSU D00693]
MAFLPQPTADERPEGAPPPQPALARLEGLEGTSLGLTGAVQGRYSREQALLDVTQGARTSASAYDPEAVPELELFGEDDGGGLITGWLAARARAETAPADVVPGLLGSRVPGGIAYAGVRGRDNVEAVAAADRTGRIAAVSLGAADDVARRARALLGDHRLVVAALPSDATGDDAVARLRRARTPGELLVVLQSPPEARAPQLLPTAIDGLAQGPGALTSRTTRLDGVVAAIDLAPTLLRHLRLPVPDEMSGQAIRAPGAPDADALRTLEGRLRVISARRFPALETLLAVWLVVLLAASIVADRRGVRFAYRTGALALLWMPSVLLLTAALRPARATEMAIVAGGSFVLGALTDRAARWPRGPLVPCAVAVVAYAVDLARGSDLVIRSLLGPNPRFGSRFYGIGNELEATLPVLLLLGLAVALMGRGRSVRSATVAGAAGATLGAVIGAGRLGADVGGVVTVGAGTAVAVLLLLPGALTAKRVVVAAAVPVLALVALAVLDLVTAGDGHFTRTVLRAEDGADLWETVTRRYELAWGQLQRGLMPFATLVALLAIAWAVRRRDRLYAPLAGDPAWQAALGGGLAAGLLGALSNDSGPVLLLFATAVLAVATIYVRGDPRLSVGEPPPPSSAGSAR